MPQAYNVDWNPSGVHDQTPLTDAAQMFMAARDKERARRLAADQEAYKRSEDAKDRERQALADERAKESHDFEVRAAKLKLEEAKHLQKTNDAELRIKARAATPMSEAPLVNAGQQLGVPDAGPEMGGPPTSQIQMPDTSPIQMPLSDGGSVAMPAPFKEQVEAERLKKQNEAIALYTAKQKAELANSESVAAAQIRALAAASGMAGGGADNPEQNALAKSIAEYRTDISKVASLRGNQRAQIMKQVLAINPDFDMSQYGARATLRQNYTSGTGATGITALNTVEKHLRNLETAYDELGGSKYPAARWVGQGLQTAAGQAGPAAFNTAVEAVAAEATRAFRALGGSEEDVKAWRAKLKPTMSPSAFEAAKKELRGLLQSRREEITAQVKRGGLDPNTFLAPSAEGLTPGPTEPAASGGSKADEIRKKYGLK